MRAYVNVWVFSNGVRMCRLCAKVFFARSAKFVEVFAHVVWKYSCMSYGNIHAYRMGVFAHVVYTLVLDFELFDCFKKKSLLFEL